MSSRDLTIYKPESLELLIEQAEIFYKRFFKFETARSEYYELVEANSEKPVKECENAKQASLDAALGIMSQIEQELIHHPFRQLLHKNPNYHQAFACYKKKLFNFNETSSAPDIDDQTQFDSFIAAAFGAYQRMSAQKDKLTILKKGHIKKIQKLAKALQNELNAVFLLDDDYEQKDISERLDQIINLENASKILPKRRHTKVAREMLIKELAFNFYGTHYSKLTHYKKNLLSGNDKQKLNLNISFVNVIAHLICIVDADISERRVASVVAKIKSEIQNRYHYYLNF